jgi:hypothetical protein
MTDEDTKYYLLRHLDTGAPMVVYRFFHDQNKPPEAFSEKRGWTADGDLWLSLMSGDINAADRINEEEARKLIETWGGKL